MKRVFIIALAACSCLVFIQLLSQQNNIPESYQQLFIKAETLFNGSATDSTDSLALNYYNNILTHLSPSSANAILLYNCYERAGILKQGLGYTSKDILHDYYAGLQLQHAFHLSDSILFRLLLSAGNVHYMNGVFDSSVYYFSQAEKIINKYPAAGLAGDLYNSLGALYSEAGNYVQSGNYFTKALELTEKTRPDLKEAIFAMSANIASAVKLSGYTDSALQLYKKLLEVENPSLPILNNIAGIYLLKKQPDSALQYLETAHNTNGKYGIIIYNAMAQAYMQKSDTSKAKHQLGIATSIYNSTSAGLKNNYYAATCKYLGDLMMMEGKPAIALPFYQTSIIQYDYKFNDKDIYVNPGNFIGDFASYNLFDALVAKANCFATIYNQQHAPNYFNAAITTYDSAFVLSDYIKKSIDNDEARLFISDKVFDAYKTAVDFLLSTNKNNDEDKMIHALEWISKSRAASLAITLKENTIKKYAGLPDSLLRKEQNLKVNISRLQLQLQQTTDSTGRENIFSAINTYTLQLQSLNNTFKNYPDYYKQKFAADNIDIPAMQQQVLTGKTAVICYFKGMHNLHAFVIKHDAIKEVELNFDSALKKNIDAYISGLSVADAGATYNGSAAKYLYQHIFQPLAIEIDNVNSLIIIPDQDLLNIPFEAFETSDNKYLIEKYNITYQFALPFLQKNNSVFNKKNAVAFAPFASVNSSTGFAALESSAAEIAAFPKPAQFLNQAATKRQFLLSSGNASVIHLATHAVVNFNAPADSYIAFYKNYNDDSSFKIYAHELYNLQLPKTQLVFLSACETGSGKVSQSEGALSLSRAFAFAGCPNIITSLWKAEDKSTAYISERFYKYADNGYTYAEALQKAKIDLLKDASMAQFHSPQYWSHLIFIGDVQEDKPNITVRVVMISVVVIIAVFLFYKKLKAAKK